MKYFIKNFQSYQGSIFTSLHYVNPGMAQSSFNPIKVLFLHLMGLYRLLFLDTFNPIKVLFLLISEIYGERKKKLSILSRFYFYDHNPTIHEPGIRLSILSRFYFYLLNKYNKIDVFALSILSRFYFYC